MTVTIDGSISLLMPALAELEGRITIDAERHGRGKLGTWEVGPGEFGKEQCK